MSKIYKYELDKASFPHDMAYNRYKDLKNRTQSDNVLKTKACKIAVDKKNGFQRTLASMVGSFLMKDPRDQE